MSILNPKLCAVRVKAAVDDPIAPSIEGRTL